MTFCGRKHPTKERGDIKLSNSKQNKDWCKLMDEIAASSIQVPCTNLGDVFFDHKQDMNMSNIAKRMCQECPVMSKCAAYAIEHENFGVWGGLSAFDRRKARKKLGLDPVTTEGVA
jgi:hypothetical protein